MTAAMGVGAVFGGLYVAARGRTGIRALSTSAAAFGVLIGFAAVSPALWVELIALACVGAASVGFLSKGNSTLQLGADPSMRGRVMALWSVAFMGSTPIGGPIAGAVAQHFGGRAGLVLGAAACVVAALFGFVVLHRLQERRSAAAPQDAELSAAVVGIETAPEAVEVGETVEAGEPVLDPPASHTSLLTD
jgi:MFS family permease